MTDTQREILTPRKMTKKSENTRRMLARQDFEDLALKPGFLRTLFTILETAGMFTGNYQPDGRNHAFAEGRRSLGLDILRTTEEFLGADALLRILEAEKSTHQGGSNDRSGSDYIDDRTDELGPVDFDDRPVGLQFIDYGPAKSD